AMLPSHPLPTLFPYTTLFRSTATTSRSPAPTRDGASSGPPTRATAAVVPARFRNVRRSIGVGIAMSSGAEGSPTGPVVSTVRRRSEEHTSELQSRFDLVCRLL